MRYLSIVKLCGMSLVEKVTRTRSSCRTSRRAGLKAYLWAETVNAALAAFLRARQEPNSRKREYKRRPAQ